MAEAELVCIHAGQKSSMWVKQASYLRGGWHLSAWRWYKVGHRAHPSGHGRPSYHHVHSGLWTQDTLWERQITGFVPCICVDGTFPGLSSLLPMRWPWSNLSLHPSIPVSISHTWIKWVTRVQCQEIKLFRAWLAWYALVAAVMLAAPLGLGIYL